MADGWKAPATLIAIASLALSVFTYASGRKDQEQIRQLENDKLSLEQLKTEVDLQLKKKEIARATESETRRSELSQELEAVKHDVAVYEDGVFKSSSELMMLKGELGVYELDGRTDMAEAAKKKIAIREEALKMQRAELENSQKKQTNIENQLK